MMVLVHHHQILLELEHLPFYKTKVKKGLNQPWMSMVNGLTMEMNITDTSKRKDQNIVMKCIALEKSNLIINSSDYKKMM